MGATDILSIVPTMQATAIAGSAYGTARSMRKVRPKRQTKLLVRGATNAIVGTSLLGTTARTIGSI